MDGCGNDDADFIDFTVFDAKAPVPICQSGLTTDLMPIDEDNDGTIDGGMIAIWASDFIASDIWDCSEPIRYSIARASEIDGGGTPDIDQTSLELTCADEPVVVVYIYAWDAAGNHDRCEAMVIVNDFNNLCDPIAATGATVAGLVETEDDEAVAQVEVQVSGNTNNAMMTADEGGYVFSGLTMGGDYTVTPVKDVDHKNGVSTFDIVTISKHILGLEALDSPYKMIAADVNNSKSITTLDMIHIRKLVLSVTNAFDSNTSWRFVERDYVFPDPSNPWLETLPEVININNIDADHQEMDFVAVKIGDVTGDARVNPDQSTVRTLKDQFNLVTTDATLAVGQTHEIVFSSDQLGAIQGFQFTLEWSEAVEVVDLKYDLAGSENFSTHLIKDRILTSSWHQKERTNQVGGDLFTVVVKANQSIQLSEVIRVTSKYTVAEAYALGHQEGEALMDIGIDFGTTIEPASGFKLYQNVPNPFQRETIIGFDLPNGGAATLEIHDATGRMIRRIEGEYVKGYNEVRFDKQTNKVTGVLYYTLKTDAFTATKSMVIMN